MAGYGGQADDPVMRAFGGAFLNHPGLKPTTRPPADEPYTPDADVVQDRYVGDIHSQGREAEFARFIASIKAEAWDEGYKDCFLSIDGSGWRELEDNPYRIENAR